jgi:hypothetical protein
MRAHRETLASTQRFWQCLTHRAAHVSTLARTVAILDSSVRQADVAYKCVYGSPTSCSSPSNCC